MVEKFGKKVKKLMTKDIKKTFTEHKGFVFSNVEKISASEMDTLRKKIKSSGSRYMIVKNRLADIALQEAGIDGFVDVLEDKKIVGVGVLDDDPVAILKILMEFAKEKAGFKVSKGYLEGQVLSADKVKQLSQLPGREQLIAMVVRTMNAPISGFVGVLAATLRKVMYALNAVKEKKEKEGAGS